MRILRGVRMSSEKSSAKTLTGAAGLGVPATANPAGSAGIGGAPLPRLST